MTKPQKCCIFVVGKRNVPMLEVLFRRHRFSYPSRRYRKYSERPNIFHKSLLPIHQPLVSAHQSLLSVYQPKEAISFCSSSITQEVAPLCYERLRLCGISSNVKQMRKSLPFSCFEQKNVVSLHSITDVKPQRRCRCDILEIN